MKKVKTMNINQMMEELKTLTQTDSKRIKDKINSNGPNSRGLFIDCGSNLGQGYSQFVQHFSHDLFDYILIEPNPHCKNTLEEIVARTSGNTILITEAASTYIGTVKFFGLDKDPTSQGASILKDHNNKYYESSEESAIVVPCFSLSDLISEKCSNYCAIILKLDIEGGEYQVLPDLIKNSTHVKLDACYIEFHSQYMAEPEHSFYQKQENTIRNKLSQDGVPFRIWI